MPETLTVLGSVPFAQQRDQTTEQGRQRKGPTNNQEPPEPRAPGQTRERQPPAGDDQTRRTTTDERPKTGGGNTQKWSAYRYVLCAKGK